MPAIKFNSVKKDPKAEDKGESKIPPTAAPMPLAPETPVGPKKKPSRLFRWPRNTFHIEWVRHSRPTCVVFLVVATVLTSYYTACFLTQYGTIKISNDSRFKPSPIFKEPALTRIIMVQWLMLAFVLLFGLSLFRRIFMPLYIFLAVMATNGTLVLFVVKMKQFSQGKIRPNDLSLNLVGILLVTATAHNLIYLYAMHLHLHRSYKRLVQKQVASAKIAAAQAAQALQIEEEEKKKKIDNLV